MRRPRRATRRREHRAGATGESASDVPYLVFLARGRDVEQPAVVVILDSDTAGNEAVNTLKRGGPRGRQLLRPALILQVGNLNSVTAALDVVTIIEDLVPLGIAFRACRRYAAELCGSDKQELDALNETNVRNNYQKDEGVFKALSKVFSGIPAPQPLHLDKVAFARHVLEETARLRLEQASNSVDAAELIGAFDKNFSALFTKLNAMKRDAEREARGERVSFRVERAKKAFIMDHPLTATKEQVVILLEEIEAVLDSSQESDEIRTEIQSVRRDFKLDIGLKEDVSDIATFKERLERLKYAGRIASQDGDSVATSDTLLGSESRTPDIESTRTV